jgi:hypothetical protein
MCQLRTPHNYLIALSVFFMWLTTASAQSGGTPLGEPNAEEIRLKKCPTDSSATAMYLLNSQQTSITEGMVGRYTSTTTRRYRIKIFDPKGYKYANVKFPIYTGKYRKISDIKAFVYYSDSSGRIYTERLTRQDIFKDKAAKGVNSYAFAFPNVRPGCVIEYTFTVEDQYSSAVPSWLIQYSIPTARAHCKIEVPYGKQLSHKLVAGDNVKVTDTVVGGGFSARKHVHTYTASNITALKAEPLMGPIRNKLQRIEFSLDMYADNILKNPGWANINDYFHFKSSRFADEELIGADTLIANAKNLKTISARVEYLFGQLKKIMRWDGGYTFFANEIQDAWMERAGNNAELNLILLNLLQKSGVNAAPLLVSTRAHGKIDKNFVKPSQFNGLDVLVHDSTGTFVLDVTAKNLSYEVTPGNVINTEAFLVDSVEGQWVKIVDERALLRQSFIIFSQLDANGVVSGSATVEYFDYAKEAKLTAEEKEDEEETDRPELKDDSPDITIEDFKSDSTQGDLFPLVETFKFKMPLEDNNNLFLLNPCFLAGFRNNPFVSDKRTFDIDFGANQNFMVILNLVLPDNFIIEEMPKNITLIKSDSTIFFRRKSAVQGNTFQCQIRLDYTESYFPKEDYANLLEFFKRMYGFLNEPVVLRRKK